MFAMLPNSVFTDEHYLVFRLLAKHWAFWSNVRVCLNFRRRCYMFFFNTETSKKCYGKIGVFINCC